MKMTSREELLLRRLMDFDIHRYLLANTVGREDGHEKSVRHISLVKTMMSFLLCVPVKDTMITDDMFDLLHDATRELTDHLDKIGLPLDNKRPDYDVLCERFFDEFTRICLEVYDASKN